MSVNKVILVGNVGKDPETRYLDDQTAISKFPLATSENYKNRSGERVSTTEWHNIVLWRGLAQIAEKYVKKGTQLYIEGRIKTRSYDDTDGNKKYITEIVGDQMQLLGKRPDEGDDGSGYGNGAAQGGSAQGSATPSYSGSPKQSGAPGQGTPSQPSQDRPGQQQMDEDPFDGGDEGPDDLPF